MWLSAHIVSAFSYVIYNLINYAIVYEYLAKSKKKCLHSQMSVAFLNHTLLNKELAKGKCVYKRSKYKIRVKEKKWLNLDKKRFGGWIFSESLNTVHTIYSI